MLFCNANREAVRQRLLSDAASSGGPGKVAVTAVAKELGALWKTLSDEEKAKYKSQAEELQKADAQQKAEAQAQRASEGEGQQGDGQPGDGQAGEGGDGKPAAQLPAALPVSWVRKVVSLDKDIQRCSADASMALSAVADVFLAAMCAKATSVAAGAKRRTIRLDDFERAVRGDKRLVQAGMVAVCSMVAAQAKELQASKEQQAAAGAGTAGEEGEGRGDAGGKPAAKRAKVAAGGAAAGIKVNNSIERAFGLQQSA